MRTDIFYTKDSSSAIRIKWKHDFKLGKQCNCWLNLKPRVNHSEVYVLFSCQVHEILIS